MKHRARVNYWVDVVIAVGFLLAVASGIVLYLVPSGGYQGGRNPYYGREILLLGHDVWKDLHLWGGLSMTGGVLVHLVLHWNWMVCMTRNLLRRTRRVRETTCDVTSPTLQAR